MYNNVYQLPPFLGFTASTPALPQLYFDVQTSEQRWKEICVWLKKLTEYAERNGDIANENSCAIEELDKLLDSVKNGEYADLYIDSLKNYIDNNLIQLVARQSKYVFPQLIWDGECWRYAVVIPKSWDYLRFNYVWHPEDTTFTLELSY